MRRIDMRIQWQPGQIPSLAVSPQRESPVARVVLSALARYLLTYLMGQQPSGIDMRLSVELHPDATAQVTLPPDLSVADLLQLLYVAADLAASPDSQPRRRDRTQE